MIQARIFAAIALAIAFGLPKAGWADQTPTEQQVNTTFSAMTANAQSLKQHTNTPASAAAASISDSTQQLTNIYTSVPSISPDYYKAIKFDQTLLQHAAQNPNAANAQASLNFVDNDLKLKAEYSQSQTNGFSDSFREVRLNVSTLHNGQTVNNYDVACNPRRFGMSEPAMYVFSGQTSPATRLVPPGVYTVLILKNNVIVAHKDVDLGSDPSNSQSLAVDIP